MSILFSLLYFRAHHIPLNFHHLRLCSIAVGAMKMPQRQLIDSLAQVIHFAATFECSAPTGCYVTNSQFSTSGN